MDFLCDFEHQWPSIEKKRSNAKDTTSCIPQYQLSTMFSFYLFGWKYEYQKSFDTAFWVIIHWRSVFGRLLFDSFVLLTQLYDIS